MFSLLGWFAPKAVKSFLNIERTSHIGIVPEARRAAFSPVYCIEKRYSDGGGGIWTPIAKKMEASAARWGYYVLRRVRSFPKQKSLALNAVARTRADVTDVTVDHFLVSSSTHPHQIFSFVRDVWLLPLCYSIRAQKELSCVQRSGRMPTSAPISKTISFLSALACQNPGIFIFTRQDLSP